MNRLYLLAHKEKNSQPFNSEDSIALQYLISNYEEQKRSEKSIFHAESWAVIYYKYLNNIK